MRATCEIADFCVVVLQLVNEALRASLLELNQFRGLHLTLLCIEYCLYEKNSKNMYKSLTSELIYIDHMGLRILLYLQIIVFLCEMIKS